MRPKDRQKALNLRKSGMSYSQIKKEIGVHKSTLSYWFDSTENDSTPTTTAAKERR